MTPDVNVLIAASRSDHPHHAAARAWLDKTITDCFKLRSKVGLGVALEVLREGWKARKFTMHELRRYAQVNRMTNVMRPYIEALTG